MPVIRYRVVCGLLEVMVTFCPTRAFTRVDFPTLGRPTTAIVPQRNPGVLGPLIPAGARMRHEPLPARRDDGSVRYRPFATRARGSGTPPRSADRAPRRAWRRRCIEAATVCALAAIP